MPYLPYDASQRRLSSQTGLTWWLIPHLPRGVCAGPAGVIRWKAAGVPVASGRWGGDLAGSWAGWRRRSGGPGWLCDDQAERPRERLASDLRPWPAPALGSRKAGGDAL